MGFCSFGRGHLLASDGLTGILGKSVDVGLSQVTRELPFPD